MEPDKGADPRARGIVWLALIVIGLALVLILWFAWRGILSAVGNLALLILIPASVLIGIVVHAVIYVWNLPIWIIFPMAGWTLVYESYQTIKTPGPTPASWYVSKRPAEPIIDRSLGGRRRDGGALDGDRSTVGRLKLSLCTGRLLTCPL
jgi:hypothetical protein